MSEQNKRLFVQLMDEVFNRGNLDVADEFVAPDFFNHEAPDSGGPEGFKATPRWLRTAFPDLHAELHELVAEHDLVVGRLTLSGTHLGEFMGRPPPADGFRCSTSTSTG